MPANPNLRCTTLLMLAALAVPGNAGAIQSAIKGTMTDPLSAEPANGTNAANSTNPPSTNPPSGSNPNSANSTNPSSSTSSSSKSGPKSPGTNPTSDPSADTILFLEVEINGHSIEKIGEFTLRSGKLMARPNELIDLGFKVDGHRKGDSLIPLSDLPGLSWNIDSGNQVLHVRVSDSERLPTRLGPDVSGRPRDHRVIESGNGVTVNYDVVGTLADSANGVSAGLDARAFSRIGIASSGWLAYGGATQSPASGGNFIRLDSAYSFADVNRMLRYTGGDFITNSLAWNRPVHLGGVQIRSDFSTRPDLVTFPLPSLSGSAAVPSTVDVLSESGAVTSGQVAPGPFEIPQIPVVSGAGTITMTMTNALGQQVTVNQPFYATYSLLAKGLQTFSAQAGPVRRNWGTDSFNYGKFAGVGNYRRGLSSKTTIEGDLEGTVGTFLPGVGVVQQVGHLGELDFSAEGSFGDADPGWQVFGVAQHIGRKFSLGSSATLANRDFRDIASMNGDAVLRKQLSGFTSLTLPHFGTAGAAYAGLDEDAAPHPLSTGTVTSIHTHVVSGNYSYQLGRRLSFYANAFQSLDHSGSSGVQAGVVIALGRRSSANIGWTSDGNAVLQVQQSAAQVHQWGYQGYVSAGHTQHEFGFVQYKSLYGLYTAGVDSGEGETTGRLEASGAISVADRRFFLSNAIYDSFAIVDTSPLAHVPVLQENRDVGKTGSSGRLLVPDMRAFELNHIAVQATGLPADVTIDNAERVMRPQDRSGVVVRIPIKFSHGALLRITDEAGKPIPPGSSAKLVATGATVPVGYDGEVYVEELSPSNQLDVELPKGQHCTAVFEYHPIGGEIPEIGPVRCVEQKP
jgi:outer membrane usher protein